MEEKSLTTSQGVAFPDNRNSLMVSLVWDDEYQKRLSKRYNFKAPKLGEGLSLRDTTRKGKRVAEILRLSEERFSKAFHFSPCMMAIISLPEFRYVDVNQHWLNVVGCTRDDVVGRTIIEIGAWPESQLQKMIQILEENGKVQNLEIMFLTSQVEMRYGLWSGEIIEFSGECCLLGTTIDMTERNQLEREMARLDRLNAIGEVAASIVHEIRNPMTVVRGYLQMLQQKDGLVSYKKSFNIMIDELDRANIIITEFLSLTRNAPAEVKRQSLNCILATILPLIQADAIKTGKVINLELGDIPDLNLDEKQIRQLILNLTRNGLEAMSERGFLTIKTYVDADEVVLSVKDEGKGIAPEMLQKLGTPFFTTKEQGAGLGLTVCYKIAESHGAFITIETDIKGTTFMVHFKG